MYKVEFFRNGEPEPLETMYGASLATLYRSALHSLKGRDEGDHVAFFTKNGGVFHFLTICYKTRFTGYRWSEYLSISRPADARTNKQELFILRNN